MGALFAASAITHVAAGTGFQKSDAFAFSKNKKFVELTLCINNQVSAVLIPATSL
jgi:hypothetical protein